MAYQKAKEKRPAADTDSSRELIETTDARLSSDDADSDDHDLPISDAAVILRQGASAVEATRNAARRLTSKI